MLEDKLNNSFLGKAKRFLSRQLFFLGILSLSLVNSCGGGRCTERIQNNDGGNYHQETIKIHYINVKQGDATLIETPEGKHILIDCGDSSRIIDYLQEKNIQNIEVLGITHSDMDHIGQCGSILNLANVKYVLVSKDLIMCDYTPCNALDALVASELTSPCAELSNSDGAISSINGYCVINKDISLTLDSSLEIKAMVAYDTREMGSDNDRSLVLKMNYNQVSFLFPGDCGEACQLEIVNDVGQIDILKTPHHCLDNSSSEYFLDTIKPAIGIISTGWRCTNATCLNRLKERNIETYLTTECNSSGEIIQEYNIIIETNGVGYEVTKESL